MIIKFLGTASNGGLPQQDCSCKNCDVARRDKNRRRLRSSLAFSDTGKTWSIIDCGPDFRQQLINNNILVQDIKLITLTHFHSDHITGLVELGFGKPLTINISMDELMKKEFQNIKFFKYLLDFEFLQIIKPKNFEAIMVKHWQGHQCRAIIINGIKRIFYVTDCEAIDDTLLEKMSNCDLIIFDGTFLDESKFGHISIKESCPVLASLHKPVIFTHFDHSQDIHKANNFISKFNFKTANDGNKIVI
jgi:phosphoribosyl 1,2-cyclic phosphate phosphodiesterase